MTSNHVAELLEWAESHSSDRIDLWHFHASWNERECKALAAELRELISRSAELTRVMNVLEQKDAAGRREERVDIKPTDAIMAIPLDGYLDIHKRLAAVEAENQMLRCDLAGLQGRYEGMSEIVKERLNSHEKQLRRK